MGSLVSADQRPGKVPPDIGQAVEAIIECTLVKKHVAIDPGGALAPQQSCTVIE